MSQDNPANPFSANEPQDVVGEVIRQAQEVRRLTKQEILSSMSPRELALLVDRIGKNMWVVLDSTGRTVAFDPALRQPFHHNNRKFAEQVADEIGGHAMLWSDAIAVLTKNNKPTD